MTSIALITTTINVPHVLRTYRECGPSVEIIVAGDVTTDAGCPELCAEIGARYLPYDEQERLYPALSAHIGPRSIQRRNFALLEALRSGADIVVSVDTDNWPHEPTFFDEVRRRFAEPFTGYVAEATAGWWNPGGLGRSPYYYRGFPYSLRGDGSWGASVRSMTPSEKGTFRTGIFNALVLGDPDCSATERMDRHPVVGWYENEAIDGVLVGLPTFAPLNSQATAYLREFVPLMGLPPSIGRYDDIFGGWVAQAVMAETDYRVVFGAPFVRQERHEHNLYSDLKAELWGMEYTDSFSETLRRWLPSPRCSVTDNLNNLAMSFSNVPQFSGISHFYQVWLDAVAGTV